MIETRLGSSTNMVGIIISEYYAVGCALWKINMEPTNHALERNMIFQTSMFMFHVNLQGCMLSYFHQYHEYVFFSVIFTIQYFKYPLRRPFR